MKQVSCGQVVVEGFREGINQKEIVSFFSECGEIVDMKRMKESGLFIVTFSNCSEAKEAVSRMNGKKFNEKTIELKHVPSDSFRNIFPNYDLRYTSFISTDRQSYKPGESVHIRCTFLNTFDRTPLPNSHRPTNSSSDMICSIFGPNGELKCGGDDLPILPPQNGVLAFTYPIPEESSGGEHKIVISMKLRNKQPFKTLEELRTFQNNSYNACEVSSMKDISVCGDSVECTYTSAPQHSHYFSIPLDVAMKGNRVRIFVDENDYPDLEYDKSVQFGIGPPFCTSHLSIANTMLDKLPKFVPKKGSTYEFVVSELDHNVIELWIDGESQGIHHHSIRSLVPQSSSLSAPQFYVFFNGMKQKITFLDNGTVPNHVPITSVATRKFDVEMKRKQARYTKRITFPRQGFGEGDLVRAVLDVKRSEGGTMPPILEVRASAVLDGVKFLDEHFNNVKDGKLTFEFFLPKEILDTKSTLNISLREPPSGVLESTNKTIPIVSKSIDIQFFPESGDLIEGVENGVYFMVRSEIGEIVDFTGDLLARKTNNNNKNDQLSIIKKGIGTVHEGRGFFTYIPEPEHEYCIRVTNPSSVTNLCFLPTPKNFGCSLRLLKKEKEEEEEEGEEEEEEEEDHNNIINIVLESNEKMKIRVGVFMKEHVVYETKVLDITAYRKYPLKLKIFNDLFGVMRVTVFLVNNVIKNTSSNDDDDMLFFPISERLVFVRPRKRIGFSVTTNKDVYSPGEEVEVCIKPYLTHNFFFLGEETSEVEMNFNNKPCFVSLTVTDNSEYEMIEKRRIHPMLEEMVYLEHEVNNETDFFDCFSYLRRRRKKKSIYSDDDDVDDVDPVTCCDLLLGVQGWRRYVYHDLAKKDLLEFIKNHSKQVNKKIDQFTYFKLFSIPDLSKIYTSPEPSIIIETKNVSTTGTTGTALLDMLFGKKMTTKEYLRKWRRELRREKRMIDRYIRELQRDQRKTVLEMKKAARSNESEKVREIARSIVYIRNSTKRYYVYKAHLNSIEIKLSEIQNVKAFSQDHSIMMSMNFLVYPRYVRRGTRSQTLIQMAKEMQKCGLIGEYYDEMLDDIIDDGDEQEEEEVEEMINSVIEETFDISLSSSVQKEQKKTSDVDEDDLQERLNRLRGDGDSEPPPQQPQQQQEEMEERRSTIISEDVNINQERRRHGYARRRNYDPGAVIERRIRSNIEARRRSKINEETTKKRNEAIRIRNEMKKLFRFTKEYSHVHHQQEESSRRRRNDFTPTIYFCSEKKVLTNNCHEQRFKFQLNDSITQFRLLIDAYDANGNIGSASHNLIRSIKPFSISLKLPLELNYPNCDVTKIPIGIFNNFPQNGYVDLIVVDDDDEEERVPSKILFEKKGIPISSNERKVEYFELSKLSPKPNNLKKRIKAKGKYYIYLDDDDDEKNKENNIIFTSTDEVEEEVRLVPYGFEKEIFFSCMLSESHPSSKISINSLKEQFKKNNNLVPLSFHTEASVSPGSISLLLQSLTGLIGVPSGCLEQVISKLYPMTMVLKIYNNMKKKKKKLENLIFLSSSQYGRIYQGLTTGYEKICGYEVKGGGFDWFGRGDGNESLTALTILQLLTMKDNYNGAKSYMELMIQRSVRWLLGSRRDKKLGWGFLRGSGRYSYGHASKSICDAYILWVISKIRKMGFFMQKEKDILDDNYIYYLATLEKLVKIHDLKNEEAADCYILSLVSLAYFNIGMKEESFKLVSEMVKLYLRSCPSEKKFRHEMMCCEKASSSITRSGGKSLVLETTSLLCLACMNFMDDIGGVDSQNSFKKEIEGMIGYIAKSNNRGRFGSTQATILCLEAILKYFEFLEKSEEVRKTTIEEEGEERVGIKVNGILVGEEVPIPKFGMDSVHILSTREIGLFLNNNKEEEEDVEIEVYGKNLTQLLPFSMSMNYKLIMPDFPEEKNESFLFQQKLLLASDDKNPKEGELVELEIYLKNKKSKESLPMIICQINLPSGLEPRVKSIKEMMEANKFDYYELFGSRSIVFYWVGMESGGEIRFRFDLLAAVPGVYTGSPSVAWLYYNEEQKTYIDGLKVTISK